MQKKFLLQNFIASDEVFYRKSQEATTALGQLEALLNDVEKNQRLSPSEFKQVTGKGWFSILGEPLRGYASVTQPPTSLARARRIITYIISTIEADSVALRDIKETLKKMPQTVYPNALTSYQATGIRVGTEYVRMLGMVTLYANVFAFNLLNKVSSAQCAYPYSKKIIIGDVPIQPSVARLKEQHQSVSHTAPGRLGADDLYILEDKDNELPAIDTNLPKDMYEFNTLYLLWLNEKKLYQEVRIGSIADDLLKRTRGSKIHA